MIKYDEWKALNDALMYLSNEDQKTIERIRNVKIENILPKIDFYENQTADYIDRVNESTLRCNT